MTVEKYRLAQLRDSDRRVVSRQEWEEVVAKRQGLSAKSQELQRDLMVLNASVAKIPPHLRSEGHFNRRQKLVGEHAAVTVKLREIRLWLGTHRILTAEERTGHRSHLDEYDVANALSEPQTLLHRCYVLLKKKCSQIGYTEEDRAIVDAANDYLTRKGILLR